MKIEELHEPSNSRLCAMLPPKQAKRVFKSKNCDIAPDFLGFVGIYERLAEIIPTHWTVIDLGCAYAPQAFFFRNHRAYVGVNLRDVERFSTPNSKHYDMSIEDFIAKHAAEYDQNKTFAICSYVPPWGGDNGAMVRAAFKNVFVYYPSGHHG